MSCHRFEVRLGLLLLLLTTAFWLWQNPGPLSRPIGSAEQAAYREALGKLPVPAADRDALIAATAGFMAADDGQPVYMLNLMRYHPSLQRFDGAPEFAGTPEDSNRHYEDGTMPLLFGLGGYPLYAGRVSEPNLLEHAAELDQWSRVLVVRYPNRRAFMNLICDPAYAPLAPYKLMALQVVLTPGHGEILLPPMHWAVAAIALLLFLAVGWWRAARRR